MEKEINFGEATPFITAFLTQEDFWDFLLGEDESLEYMDERIATYSEAGNEPRDIVACALSDFLCGMLKRFKLKTKIETDFFKDETSLDWYINEPKNIYDKPMMQLAYALVEKMEKTSMLKYKEWLLNAENCLDLNF